MKIVREPTLPKNINIIIRIFPRAVNEGVPPILRPTVANADITSKLHSSNVNSGFTIESIKVPNSAINTPIKKIPNDFLTVVLLILL